MSDLLENEEQLLEWAETSDRACVVIDALHEPLLIFFGGQEGEWLCYQGIPEALTEDGTDVDPHHGSIGNLSAVSWPLRPIWPGINS
jgi:hypothetical protein